MSLLIAFLLGAGAQITPEGPPYGRCLINAASEFAARGDLEETIPASAIGACAPEKAKLLRKSRDKDAARAVFEAIEKNVIESFPEQTRRIRERLRSQQAVAGEQE